jgi:hypothetical protein
VMKAKMMAEVDGEEGEGDDEEDVGGVTRPTWLLQRS